MDAIRLVAATAVVYAHSYPIAGGLNTPDPLVTLLGGRIGLGDYAVRVFFILSGFLLSGSLDMAPDPLRYLVNRLLRLIPGFVFAILVSVLLFAPFMSDLGWRLIVSHEGWSTIYWSISLLSDVVTFELSRVPRPDLVWFMNGSLWSIRYELVCYLVLLALYMLFRKDSRVAWAALALAVVAMAGPRLGLASVAWREGSNELNLPLAMFPPTLPYFCSGAAFYAIYKRWGVPRFSAAIAVLTIAVAALFELEAEALALAGPPLLVQLSSHRTMLSWVPDRLGDISYGVYLFGWPAGLLVASTTGAMHALVIFALSVPIAFLSAYAMHRLVERPVSGRVRPLVLRRLPRFTLPSRAGETDAARKGAGITAASGARALAYAFCFVMVARFTIYPYPFSLNWYGFQVRQLVGICIVTAAIIAVGDTWDRWRASREPVHS